MDHNDPDYRKPEPCEYQVIRNGMPVPITDLSREDLILELVKAMDCIEDLDETLYKFSNNVNSRVAAWRNNR